MIRIKRVYEKAAPGDGTRVLVDRLWPRGLTKRQAAVDTWLRELAPSRIGHGIRSVEDPKLITHLKQQHIHLEVCPTSNVQTNVCKSLRDHPVDRLYRSGISLSINTDSRTITDTTLSREYQELEQTFQWSREELLRCNLEAIRAAFLPAEARQRLESQLMQAYSAQPLSATSD